MSNCSNGKIGRLARTYLGAASAVFVYISYRVGLVKEFGGSIGEERGSQRSGDKAARERSATRDALGTERSRHFAVVRLGREGIARDGLQVSVARKLVARVE